MATFKSFFDFIRRCPRIRCIKTHPCNGETITFFVPVSAGAFYRSVALYLQQLPCRCFKDQKERMTDSKDCDTVNITGYRFIELDDQDSLRAVFLEKCNSLGLKGLILIAPEGVNKIFKLNSNANQNWVPNSTSDKLFPCG